MFWLPGAREICLWMGAVDAGKKTAQYILDKTRLSLFIYPGGSKEIFLTNPKSASGQQSSVAAQRQCSRADSEAAGLCRAAAPR